MISTISIAEYCVGGAIDQLPLKNLIMLPFNIEHAEQTGKFGRIVFDAKKENELKVDERPIIINDAKLFAQAHLDERIRYYLTSDTRSFNIFNLIHSKLKLDFSFLNLRDDHAEIFGILNL